MSARASHWGDQQTESVIGFLLRMGVLTAASFVALGGIFYLARSGSLIPADSVFQGEPARYRTVSGILSDALSFHPLGIIQLGLLILIATPVSRVAFSVVAFAMEGDALYVVVTLIVLGVLVFSLAGGHL